MNDPYVATPRGFRRKIGPKSRYGMNDDAPAFGDGIGPQGAQSSGNRRSSFTGQTKLGTPFAKQESGFAARMREAREVSEANKFDRRKPTPSAPAAGKAPLENARNGPAATKAMGMLDKARAAGKAPKIFRPKTPAKSKAWEIGLGPKY